MVVTLKRVMLLIMLVLVVFIKLKLGLKKKVVVGKTIYLLRLGTTLIRLLKLKKHLNLNLKIILI